MHSRKMLFTTVMALSSLASLVRAQGRAPVPFVVHQLSTNVYFADGAGCNSGIIVGEKSVIVIDAKLNAEQGRELVQDIAKITPKPIGTVILTHIDADHVNGLASFPAGIAIIAHANAKKQQQGAIAAGSWVAFETGTPPAPGAWIEPMPFPDRLPTQVVSKKREQLKIDGVKLELLHWGPAHTNGDLVVYLPEQKIVFTGDITSTNHPDPTIHREKGGLTEGWLATTQRILALNADQFVPGHGELQTKATIEKLQSAVEAKRAKIKDLVAQGKSLDEVRVAVGDPPPPQPGSTRGPVWPSFTEVVYREFKRS